MQHYTIFLNSHFFPAKYIVVACSVNYAMTNINVFLLNLLFFFS